LFCFVLFLEKIIQCTAIWSNTRHSSRIWTYPTCWKL